MRRKGKRFLAYNIGESVYLPVHGKHNLAYRTGQSVDLTLVGNHVFTLSRDLSFPYHVINRTKVITVHAFYSVACNCCKFNIVYQIGQTFDFTMIGNPSCCHFYPLLVLKWHSDPWPTVTSQPIRLSTNFMTLIPSLTFTDYEWFPWSICNGCGMSAGNAYPSGHLVPSPIVGLACSPIVETRFFELAKSLLDFLPRIPLGTSRFCLNTYHTNCDDVTRWRQTAFVGVCLCGKY